MVWTLFFKVVGIAYATYYCTIIGYDLSPLNKKGYQRSLKNKNGRNENANFEGVEFNMAHLKFTSEAAIVPIKASSIVPLHTEMKVKAFSDTGRTKEIIFDESIIISETPTYASNRDVEDIDKYLDADQRTQTMEGLFSASHTEMEDVASNIFSKYK